MTNAPIVEAVLDVRVEPASGVEVDTLAALQAKLPSRFSTRELRVGISGEFGVQAGKQPTATAKAEPIAQAFRTGDNTQTVLAGPAGFSFSQLRPYRDWEALSSESREAWESYRSIARPKKIQRIALRFINKMALPLPISDMKDYLRTVPEIGEGLPQGISNFFFRVELPVPERKAGAIIIETVDVNAVTARHVPVILDIDVFREGAFPLESAKLWPLFEPLHELKNELFFGSITDKTLELFR